RLVDIAVQYTENGVEVRVDFVRYGGRGPHKRIRLWDLRPLSQLPHRVSEALQRLPPAVALHGQLELDSAAASAHGEVALVDMPLLAHRRPKTLIPWQAVPTTPSRWASRKLIAPRRPPRVHQEVHP